MRYWTLAAAGLAASVWLAYSTLAQPQPEPRGEPPVRPNASPGYPGPGFVPMPPFLRALDANGDGELSAAEIDNAPKALRSLDRNGDGRLTREEMGIPFGPPRDGVPGGGPGPMGRPEPPAGPPQDMGAPPRGMFGGPGRGPGRDFGSTYVGEPLAKNDAEKKILDTMANMVGGRNLQNVPPSDGRLLRLLTEAIGAKNVVEIGTSNGYSALWISMALKSTGGKLTTFEIDPERIRMARENFRRAGVDQIVTVVEGDAHEQVTKLKDPIDLLFIDADKEGYADYLKKLLPLVRPGGLILAHNFDMLGQDYVRAVTTNPNLETIYLPSSFGVTLKKR